MIRMGVGRVMRVSDEPCECSVFLKKVIEAKSSVAEEWMEKDSAKMYAWIAKNRYTEGMKGYMYVMCCGVTDFWKSTRVERLKARGDSNGLSTAQSLARQDDKNLFSLDKKERFYDVKKCLPDYVDNT